MGYYTLYTLSVEVGDPNIIDSQEFQDIFYKTTSYNIENLYDTIKWYSCTENMIQISKLYPDVVFKLCGDGEDRDDRWIEYYCNGEAVRSQASIVYPPVDVSSIGKIKDRCPELFI